MIEIYGQQHLAMQAVFGTVKLAERLDQIIVATEMADDHQGFIAARDMFF
jgi:hypothetical protein